MRTSRIILAAALAATTSASAGTGEAAVSDVAQLAVGMLLGNGGAGQEQAPNRPWDVGASAGVHAGQNVWKGLRGNAELQPCGADERGQTYPGFQGALCKVSPTEASSPQRPAQRDKAGS